MPSRESGLKPGLQMLRRAFLPLSLIAGVTMLEVLALLAFRIGSKESRP